MKTENKRFIGVITLISLVLLIPLTAMQFTNEVSWSLYDFIIAGSLLFGTGTLIEYILRNVKTKQNRILLSLFVLVLLFLIWLEMAVGFFGTPLAGS